MFEARTLKFIWDVGLNQYMTLMAKVKVTVTSSTKQAYNWAMLGARTLKYLRDVSSDRKRAEVMVKVNIILRAKVMVKVNMTFRTVSLLAMLCII